MSKNNLFPNKKVIEEVLSYNKETGKFTWKKLSRRWKNRVGKQAGYVNKRGYRVIGIDGKIYRAHRLAWFLEKGDIPKNTEIDHIDGNMDNNKIENLRLVNTQENAKNRKLPRTSTSGVLGVWWHKNQKKWNAGIKVDGKQIYLGSFSEKGDAEKARLEANKNFNFHKQHGRKT